MKVLILLMAFFIFVGGISFIVFDIFNKFNKVK